MLGSGVVYRLDRLTMYRGLIGFLGDSNCLFLVNHLP